MVSNSNQGGWYDVYARSNSTRIKRVNLTRHCKCCNWVFSCHPYWPWQNPPGAVLLSSSLSSSSRGVSADCWVRQKQATYTKLHSYNPRYNGLLVYGGEDAKAYIPQIVHGELETGTNLGSIPRRLESSPTILRTGEPEIWWAVDWRLSTCTGYIPTHQITCGAFVLQRHESRTNKTNTGARRTQPLIVRWITRARPCCAGAKGASPTILPGTIPWNHGTCFAISIYPSASPRDTVFAFGATDGCEIPQRRVANSSWGNSH